MLRVCLFFLAMVQQFMPPGMCLCMGLPTGKATPPRAAVTPQPIRDEPSQCRCCGQGHHRGAAARAESPDVAPATPVPSAPLPQPCCPGLLVDVHQALFSASDPTDRVTCALACGPAPDAGVNPTPAMPQAPVEFLPLSAQPLYVCHCTLLI